MKLRSLFIALTLGFILCLAPIITAYLPALAFWHSLARLAEKPTADSRTPQTNATSAPTQPAANSETALLVISKSSSPAVVMAGDLLTYTILITNTGPATAQTITLSDTLPAGVRFYGESNLTVIKGTNPQLQVGERQITGTVSTLQKTGRMIFIGHALVDPAATGTSLTNTAVVTATNNSNSNNRATIETPLVTATPTPTLTPTTPPTPSATPSSTATAVATAPTATPTALPDLADLQITQSVQPNPVVAGALVTYTIVVSNAGPGHAHNLAIQGTLPQDLFFDGRATLSVLHGQQPQLLLNRTQLTGTLTLLNSGGLVTITAPARTPNITINEIRINTATVDSTTPDPQAANNSTGGPLILLPAAMLPNKNFLPAITK